MLPLDHPGAVLGSTLDTWATVAVAIGTIGAVAYALFRDVVITPRRRPKLELLFDGSGNDQVVVSKGAGDVAQIRLRVSNAPGKDTADDVVAVVTEVRRMDPATTVTEATPVGLPLTWSGSNPPLTVASVHPGSQRHIDFLHADLPAPDEAGSEITTLELDLTPNPAGGEDKLTPGKFEIAVEVRARNADAICYVIPADWEGTWTGKAAMWDHLRVEPPRRVR